MTRIYRWWNTRKNKSRIVKRIHEKSWKEINPYWFKHEIKKERIQEIRNTRHDNKVKLRKGSDIERYDKTQGWLSH